MRNLSAFTLTRLALILALLAGGASCRAQPAPTGSETASAAAEPASSPSPDLTFGDRIGITVHFNQGQTLDYLDNLVDLGVKWVRDSENWKVVEQSPGQYVFPDRFKKRLAFYREHDIAVCYGVWYGNPVAYPDKPFDPQAYGRYAAAVAGMLDEAGVEFVLELWNEPHNFALGDYFGGNGNAKPPSAWADHYVAMVRAAVETVKAVDPNVTLLTNEDYLVAHYWFLERGLPKALDGFALHPYVHGPSPGPEKLSYGPDVEWAQPFTVIDENQSFASMIRRVTHQYETKLGHDMELWITEWGYRLGKHVSKDERIDEGLAASFLPRLYILSVANGARVVMWHNLNDMRDGPYGLIRNDGTKRATYAAFRTMSRRLGDQHLVKQIEGKEHPTKGVQAYLFKGPLEYQLVAWAMTDGHTVEIDTGSSAPLKAYDKFGESIPITWQRDGLPTIELGRSPVYVTGVLDDVTLIEVADAE